MSASGAVVPVTRHHVFDARRGFLSLLEADGEPGAGAEVGRLIRKGKLR